MGEKRALTLCGGGKPTEKVIEKSRFITYSAHAEGEAEARRFLAGLKEEHPFATHICYAFVADRLGNLQRFSDDGEPQGTAGMPILAQQNIEEYYMLPQNLVGGDEVFILSVQGESMIEAGILDGDFVIVRRQSHAENGDIVVAMIDAYVDAQLYHFDITPDVSMHLLPAVMEPTPFSSTSLGLQCAITF